MGFSQAPGLPYSKLGIPEDGDAASRAISKGKYVIWKGKNYFAKTDILQGETFVEDTNLTEIPDGAINGIADALNASLMPDYKSAVKLANDALNSVGKTFTAPSDGWLYITSIVHTTNAQEMGYAFTIDGIEHIMNDGREGWRRSTIVPMRKGCVVEVTYVYNVYSVQDKMYFIPKN